MKKLYFGDNLEIMQKLFAENPNGFIDLIYIDPPFNSKRNYNVLFENIDLADSKAQRMAFADTWSNVSYFDTLNELKILDLDLFNFLDALQNTRISKGAISYLSTMSIRIFYMHKLLKNTGSFYLHCDPTMSHYLKIVCDMIFGENNFRNEIVWHYRRWTGKSRNFQKLHDVILFYSKTKNYTFNEIFTEYTKGSVGRKKSGVLHRFKGDEVYLVSDGEVDERGVRENDVWHIPFIAPSAKERLGYPTQKPEALLERIIKASTNEGDLVADFFCGCGTAVAVAEKLNRNWLGVDISHLAVRLIKDRLINSYKNDLKKLEKLKEEIVIDGFPKDLDSAKELAKNVGGGRLKFEEWIVDVCLGGTLNERKNETGFDGHRVYEFNGKRFLNLIEVKSGGATLTQLNHFIETLRKRKGDLGTFVCFADEVTSGMIQSAKRQGQISLGETSGYKIDVVQILTVEEILEGKKGNFPGIDITFKNAVAREDDKKENLELF
ncbi:MAG: hypothetical protein Fur0024_1060 [Patescibacteria group bacterium]